MTRVSNKHLGPCPNNVKTVAKLFQTSCHTVSIAVAWAALQGAVAAVPSVGAETRAVAAHAVLPAPRVARGHGARVPGPARRAHARAARAVAVLAALLVTQLWNGEY